MGTNRTGTTSTQSSIYKQKREKKHADVGAEALIFQSPPYTRKKGTRKCQCRGVTPVNTDANRTALVTTGGNCTTLVTTGGNCTTLVTTGANCTTLVTTGANGTGTTSPHSKH